MHNTWIDVTTILGWQRSAVGIVRTEVECATFALKMHSSNCIKFCAYTPSKGYYEINRLLVEQTIERINGHVKKKEIDSQNIVVQQVDFKTKCKTSVLKCIRLLPTRMQRKVINYLLPRRVAANSLLTSLRHGKLAFKQFFKPNVSVPHFQNVGSTVSDGAKYPFCQNDEYISLGLDWDQKDFQYLYELKKELNLKVKLFCYDVIPVKLPHLCVGDVAGKFAHYFSNVAWCANEIFCISKCSRDDLNELLKQLGTPVPKLTIVKLGCELPEIENDSEISNDVKNLLEERYILFVSTIERRKNHEVLYKAYTRLIDQKVDNIPTLVFVGMPGWGMNDFITDLHLDPRVKGKIIQLNNVSDPELTQLYRRCWFTVYPSLYEGWGLPVAESLAFGKYCLASSAASVPEVAGDLLDYIDPWDVLGWADKIKYFIENPSAIHEREERIKFEYKSTKWSDTAASIFK
ncbi:glycosyltransferase family 4 protein [Candidatus Pantoea floridensis]|uniref:Glycosyltransferase involved in cell wall bisynthesis n=1 Tax=Candidatus Pantoea floridensis TaxID=1938870 RepID=A0A286BXI0_9GAMM|nr:glycosyltransferase family 1 protein [Pantoea floridensis]PIF21349.1 glycosyltransferase involved in cell wall biosynthesis [Enterobacteriaceae bacterium JKS000233]SOD38861.1 Glycosyltransferase involved in cell wall bisynthesis [Pantoea floridensis]